MAIVEKADASEGGRWLDKYQADRSQQETNRRHIDQIKENDNSREGLRFESMTPDQMEASLEYYNGLLSPSNSPQNDVYELGSTKIDIDFPSAYSGDLYDVLAHLYATSPTFRQLIADKQGSGFSIDFLDRPGKKLGKAEIGGDEMWLDPRSFRRGHHLLAGSLVHEIIHLNENEHVHHHGDGMDRLGDKIARESGYEFEIRGGKINAS